jgi:O-antigen/teichoic acid export membrane protein
MARLLSFITSWIALQLIPNKELGVVIYALNFILFIIPLGGLGLHQGLIRYGSLLKSNEEKDTLFIYVLKKGTFVSILLIAFIIIVSSLASFRFENTSTYIILLSIIILPMYILEIIKIQFRLKHDNKSFILTEVTYNVILVVMVLVLSFYFKEKGYVVALILAPIITALIFIKKLNINFSNINILSITDSSFWKYGFFSSMSNVVTQLLFIIDILLIGNLLNNAEMITNYKYLTLIPFSILFLPQSFMNTDFVSFTENIKNKKYIHNYIKNYMLLFGIISVLFIVFSWLFSEYLLRIFGEEFIKYTETFMILVVGVCGILFIRGLFGNLLSSLGKANMNFIITAIALLLNFILNNYLIPIYGIKGAAITSAILMWFTGILSFLLFKYYFKKQHTF